MSEFRILEGDCIEQMRGLNDQCVQTCVTSPPYWGLRDYGTATWDGGDPECEHRVGGQVEDSKAGGAITAGVRPGVDASRCLDCGAKRIDSQLGLEPTPEEYVANLVAVFREVRRVLRDDGTLWLNLGDSYAGGGGFAPNAPSNKRRRAEGSGMDGAFRFSDRVQDRQPAGKPPGLNAGCKPKDLVGIPWMVAFALRSDGWYLRDEIIWAKGRDGQAGMPGPQKDRCTRSHEQIFMLTKRARYFYDHEAIREPSVSPEQEAHSQRYAQVYDGPSTERENGQPGNVNNGGIHSRPGEGGRTKRTVWNVSTTPFPGAHFATFPPKLIEPCILAGSAEGDTVLDPFAGSGTTGVVALRHGRSFIGCELNETYAEMARRRIYDDAPLFNHESATLGALQPVRPEAA